MPQLSLPILLRQQRPIAADTSNQSATTASHSSAIERLPAELRLQIIKNLPAGDLRSIYNLAFSGPTFYHLISENEASLAENVVVSAVGEDVMRIAATVYELEALGDKLPRPRSSTNFFPDKKSWSLMEEILDRHRGRDNRNWHTKSRITKFSVAASYLELDVAVRYWAKKLANRALKRAYTIVPRQRWRDDPESNPGPNPKPTATEMRRFCKALYFYHLQSIAFPWTLHSEFIFLRIPVCEYTYSMYRWWSDFTPWEYEQVRQVEILLGCCEVGRRFLFPPEHFSFTYKLHIAQGLIRMRVVDALMPWLLRKPTRGKQLGLDRNLGICKVPAFDGGYQTLSISDSDENGIVDLHAFNPEGDEGPMLWWYYDMYCSFMLGYVFWDFERLRKMTREKCPSLNDLLESSREITGESLEEAERRGDDLSKKKRLDTDQWGKEMRNQNVKGFERHWQRFEGSV
ncbi:hypothetical protein F4679DRAFT_589175 [Xylaria curta]|nr:hypothetical protein F4679DRAFT_589175 [Xylaria curta]